MKAAKQRSETIFRRYYVELYEQTYLILLQLGQNGSLPSPIQAQHHNTHLHVRPNVHSVVLGEHQGDPGVIVQRGCNVAYIAVHSTSEKPKPCLPNFYNMTRTVAHTKFCYATVLSRQNMRLHTYMKRNNIKLCRGTEQCSSQVRKETRIWLQYQYISNLAYPQSQVSVC